MRNLTIFYNALDPNERKLFTDVADIYVCMRDALGTFPATARIYHNAVAQSNDVTPHNDTELNKLRYLDGNFYVVIWPEGPITIAIIVGIVIAAVSIGLVFLLHKPTPTTGAGSPNNQLTDRQNSARPNERIPDIVGTVRSTPDLIALPYKAFINNQEFEYIYACIGRMYYEILDCLDDQTPVSWIEGEWAGVYPPFNSPNSISPVIQNQYGTAPAIIPPIVSIQQSNAVNGQQIRASNAGNFFASNNIAFQYGGTILCNGAGIDLTMYFTAGTMLDPEYLTIDENDDGINASDPAGIQSSVGLGGTYEILAVTTTSVTLSNPATVNANWNALMAFAGETSTYYHSFEIYQDGTPILGPIILNVANMTQVWANFVAPDGLYLINNKGTQVALTWTIEMDVQAVDSALSPIGDIISGSIDVVGQALEQSLVGSTLKLTLPSPGPCQVTVKSLTAMGTDKRNQWVQTVQWRDLYAVSPITFDVEPPFTPTPSEFVNWAFATSLASPGNVSEAPTLFNGNCGVSGSSLTTTSSGSISLQGGDSLSAPTLSCGWDTFVIDPALPIGATVTRMYIITKGLQLNGSSGLKISNGSGITGWDGSAQAVSTLTGLGAQMSMESTLPCAPLTLASIDFIGVAVYYTMPPGGAGNGIIPVITSGDFGDITTVYGITAQTADALSIKERKLNLLVTRTLPTWINRTDPGPPQFSATLYPTNCAADIFCALALDPAIGRRLLSEINVPEIYAIADNANQAGEHIDGDIATYFASRLMTEFCYTFDDAKTSFEESAAYLADAINCIAYRSASTISLSFEKQTDDSTLLFCHRNKLPGSEQRTFSFGVLNDNDGVTYDFVDPNAPNYPNMETTRSLYFPPDQSAINPKKITSRGVRNLVQATINGWRMYQKILYANSQTQFDATQEAQMVLRNERILVADNTRSDTQDGELIGVDGLTVTTSQDVTFTGGVTYTAYFQHYDDTVEAIAVTPGSDSNQMVLATAPLLPFVTDPGKFARTTYQVVGSVGARATPFLVQDKTPNDNRTFSLAAINYDDKYYAHDDDLSEGIVLAPVAGYGAQGYTGEGLLGPDLTPYTPPARGGFDSSTYDGSDLDNGNNPDGPPTTAPPTTPGDGILILVNGV